jgi:predicted phosphodiesterase
MEKIALISDIHGNMPALETVLNDIRGRGITRIFCLGDIVGKGPDSDKAVDICRRECEVVLRGNWDEKITTEKEWAMALWHQQKLGAGRLKYLAALPNTFDFHLSGKKVRLFHASQNGIHARVGMNSPEEKHLAMFTNTDFTGNYFEPDVVGCADIHQAYLKHYYKKILFNTGSVGNPLDEQAASYVIMEGCYGGTSAGMFSINLIRVPYDTELAIRQARDAQMPDLADYEDELRTAVYRMFKK